MVLSIIALLIAPAFSKCFYSPPFSPKKSFRIIQGFNGKYSHRPPLQYGVDFDMPIGTLVYSSRTGVVKETKENSKLGGANKKFLKHANKVIIEHDDGTKALYAHLAYNSLRVKKGQRVARGLPIGRSGCSGWCDGAHLHFEVFKEVKKGYRKSLPFKFKTKSGCTIPKLGANITY